MKKVAETKPGVSVLIVEDDRELAMLWQRHLQDHGYAVDVCSSVDDAEILIHSNTYTVAIVDIFLAEGEGVVTEGGITLINRLRLKETTGHSRQRLLVLAITGAPERTFGKFNALDSITDLSDCVLHKPVSLATLEREVNQLVEATTLL